MAERGGVELRIEKDTTSMTISERQFVLTKGAVFQQFGHLGGQKSHGALVTGRGVAVTRGTAFPQLSHLKANAFRELSSLEGGSH